MLMPWQRPAPVALFDPAADGGPPGDAWDLQFRAPRSYGAFLGWLEREDRRETLNEELGWFVGLAPTIEGKVDQSCGHAGRLPIPENDAQTTVTTVICQRGPDGTLRPHLHVYLGRCGWRVLSGEAAELEPGEVERGGKHAFFYFEQGIIRGTRDRHDFVWGTSRPSGQIEVIEPPALGQWAEQMDFPVCPGPWGPRRLLLADAESLRVNAEQLRRIDQQRAQRRAEDATWEPNLPIHEQVRRRKQAEARAAEQGEERS